MNENKKSSNNLNYINLINSDSKSESTLNLSQTDLKSTISKTINYRNRTQIYKHKAYKKNQKIVNAITRIEYSLKLKNEKKRSQSFKTGFPSFYYFNNIALEFIPLTAIIFNIPKNLKIKIVFKKLCARIDKREFIRFKYNKKTGIVYIKFRNIFYYNYYFYYFKNRNFFKNTPPIQMIKTEEINGMWAVNPLEEEEISMKFNELSDKDYNFYNNYLALNYK